MTPTYKSNQDKIREAEQRPAPYRGSTSAGNSDASKIKTKKQEKREERERREREGE